MTFYEQNDVKNHATGAQGPTISCMNHELDFSLRDECPVCKLERKYSELIKKITIIITDIEAEILRNTHLANLGKRGCVKRLKELI